MQIFSVCLCFFLPCLDVLLSIKHLPLKNSLWPFWDCQVTLSMANRHLEIGYKKVTAWITWRFLSTAFSLQFATYSQIRFTHQSAMRGWLDDSERYSIFAREIPKPPQAHATLIPTKNSHTTPTRIPWSEWYGSQRTWVKGVPCAWGCLKKIPNFSPYKIHDAIPFARFASKVLEETGNLVAKSSSNAMEKHAVPLEYIWCK